jgi:hypothetical protein
MDTVAIAKYINTYGFPIVAAGGMGYIVYFVWVWATTTAKPILEQAYNVLVELIDQIRVLDNDMIRLTQKLSTILSLRQIKKD